LTLLRDDPNEAGCFSESEATKVETMRNDKCLSFAATQTASHSAWNLRLHFSLLQSDQRAMHGHEYCTYDARRAKTATFMVILRQLIVKMWFVEDGARRMT
jgi:hypothetical protein